MDKLKQDFKYKIIKNFLSESEIDLFSKYTKMRHRSNQNSFDNKQSIIGDTYFYGDPIMESLLLCKRKLVEKESGLELLPTYAFWRMYTYLADLKAHKDRPSCEVSVTVMIDSDGTDWPIFMDGNKLELQKGDAALYLGCEVEHWREEFTGDWHSQTFLHYIDKNGPYKNANLVADGRELWGTLK